MPVVPAGNLATLRTTPQSSKLYLVVQQPARYESGAYVATDFVWYGTIRTAPDTDPVLKLAVSADAACAGVTVQDGMTVLVSSSAHGLWDRVLLRAHGDQTLLGAGANDTVYISASSECGSIEVGDKIVILDEKRPGLRFPKITEDGGDLSWYKDYGYFQNSVGEVDPDNLALTWGQLGGTDAARAEASMPAVPIMGPHIVKFLEEGESVDINFDWSDSYAAAPGAAVDAWVSEGETSHAGATWNSAIEIPGAQTYSNISGMRGFRVDLEVATDHTDPIVEFRRGSRYVFTMRRPGHSVAGDPSDAEPITDFTVSGLSGSFDSGGWTAQVTVYGNQAGLHSIRAGALAILFAEDRYAGSSDSIGPNYKTLVGRENIVMVGYISDGSISQNPEYGTVSFTVLSITELFKLKENYPVPIENRGGADEWYKTPDLTIDRACHHYLAWHTNIGLVADRYQTGDTTEIAAQDFLGGDGYSTIDNFLWDRIFARFLCDRFGRTTMEIDLQMRVAGSGTTMFAMTNADWLSGIDITEANEYPVSVADLGGLYYNAGAITPFLSHAPGDFSAYTGSAEQMMSLALTGQDGLNTSSGRLFAYRNNPYPNVAVTMTNWRVMDIWPQEYVSLTQATVRPQFSDELFIPRTIDYSHEGYIISRVALEMETDGVPGVTVPVPEDPPEWPGVGIPIIIPEPGGGGTDTGRRMVATDVGVFVTDEISAEEPFWYGVNTGLVSLDCHCLRKDPWHWWTSDTESRFWLAAGDGIWYMDDFPHGTWTQSVSIADINVAYPAIVTDHLNYPTMHFSIETEGLYAVATLITPAAGVNHTIAFVVQDNVILNANSLDAREAGVPSIVFAQHGGGNRLYASSNHAYNNLFGAAGRLWKTVNGGATWTKIDEIVSGAAMGQFSSVSVPYVDADNTTDKYVLWGKGGIWAPFSCAHYYSVDGGATWSPIAGDLNGYTRIGTSTIPERRWMPTARPDMRSCRWTNDGGVIWSDLSQVSAGISFKSSLTIWEGNALIKAYVGGVGIFPATVEANLWEWSTETDTWADKRGNLPGYGATYVYDIQRDALGAP